MPEHEQDFLDFTRRIVQQMLARRRWQQIGPEDEPAFVDEVIETARAWQPVSSRPLTEVVARATINRYCHHWYTACRAPEAAQHERAWLELYRHVYGVAQRLGDPVEAQDRAQEVLERISTRLDLVEDPGSFLSWSSQVTRHWIRQVHRQAEEPLASLDDESERQAAEHMEVTLEPEGAAAGDENVEERQRVEALVRRCLRSQVQQQVIIGRFLDNRSVMHLADELGKTPGHIRTLTHRAIARLQGCADLLERLRAYQSRGAGGSPDDEGSGDDLRLREAPAVIYLTCAAFQRQLPVYLEATLSGLDWPPHDRALNRHLNWCHACEAEYVELLELALADEAGDASGA
jgi:RNA polymerase sigma factor (sigma-70 family)